MTTADQILQLAIQHHQLGQLPQAEALYRQVLAVVPNHPAVLHNLGQMAFTLNKFDIAIDLLSRSLAFAPGDANTHNTLAATFFAVGRIEQAYRSAQAATMLDPNASPPYSNMGNALVGLGQFKAGIDAFKKSISLDPNSAIAHDGLGATLLLTGDLQRGWREAEWRWKKPGYETPRYQDRPHWDGSDLNGKRLLLMVEQGYGDVFQLCRYVPLLKQRGATVILEVVTDIHQLMFTLDGADQLVVAGFDAPPVDLVVPLMSVPLFFGTTLETIPAATPYLASDPRLLEELQNRYFRRDLKFKVGLVWAGRPTHSNDHHRSISLSRLAPFAALSDISFYSLQKGDAVRQLQSSPLGMSVTDLSSTLEDFNWTAAAISGMDLIVTVDTAVAHLAGALGKSVWVMLPFVPDWRWMLNRDDSPWYPSMQLFRQKVRGDWESVVMRVRDELAKAIHDHARIGC